MAAKGREGTVRALAAVVALALAGCGASGGGAASGSSPATGFAVGTKFATFVDTSRPTEGRADVPAKASRTLETFLYSTLTVFGGDHNRPYGGSLTTTDNADRLGATLNGPTRLVNLTVIAFLDRYLKGDTAAVARLGKALADEVTVKLEVVE